MNRGEGLRIAAKAKSGSSIGHMFQEKRTKPKKFRYKSKTQSFPVRKTIHGTIDEGNHQLGKTGGSKPKEQQKSTTTQNSSVNRQVLNQKNDAKAVNQREKAKSNFIDKNKKVLSKKEKILKQADTVTLTQDQLNAILKTIGTASELRGTPSFSIDAGELKVNLSSINKDYDNTGKENDNTESEKAKENDDNENISALITEAKNDNDTAKVQDPVNTSNEDSNNNEKTPRSGAPVEEKMQEPSKTTVPVQKQSPRLGQSNIINTIGMSEQNDRALMEKKKQQWKQELDAQLAAKKAAQERDGRSQKGRSQNANDGWNPWGQPGGGAPLRSSVDTSSPRDNQVVNTGHPSPGRSSRGQGSSGMLSQSISGLSYAERQRNVPAAMRSSFIIGGITNGHDDDLKRKEKQQWLEDLERQKREAKEKKEQEKANQRAIESAVMQQWAEPVDHPPSRMISRMDNKVSQVQDDSRVMSRMAAERKEQTKEPEQPKSAPHNSSRSPYSNEDTDISPRLHIRPANALIDPAEVERREIQRKKHLEHMAFVQAQVEEKRRKKQEALALRRQEEAEEERKLAEERNRLARDFEREQDKLRKKEEAAAAKQRALAESMQNAHDAAMREKHAERMRKLQRQGHDVSNLRKSWDDKHQSPEVSPRLGTQLQPPPKPTTSVSFSPRHDPVNSDIQGNAPDIQDAATSPIHEVSTQTEIDVLDANYISPRLIEAIRLSSAGAEYKPKSKKRSDQEKSKQLVEGDRRKDKATKVVSIKEDMLENKASKSRKNSDASKPKWGQSGQGKKIMKNSDKDMSMSKKKREERLKKRQEELLALQEKSAPKRAAQPKQTQKKIDSENQRRKSRTDTKLSHHSDEKEHRASKAQRERAGSRREAPASTQERVLSQQQSRKEFRLSSSDDSFRTQTPPRNNDFVPFMRTEDDELIEGRLSVSPTPAPISQRQIPSKNDNLIRGEASRASRHSRQSHREMDPLLNPDRLKDKEHRQEEILMQLSTLRQGLLMKQRELEIGLSPSSPVII